MKYQIQNIVLKGNEHGQLKSDVIYAKLVNENGETEISATLECILAAIRDRNLETEGVTVKWKEYRGAKNSEVSLNFYDESSIELTVPTAPIAVPPEEFKTISNELVAFINDSPPLQSLLYDINLLPEQLEENTLQWHNMLLIADAWKNQHFN